MIKRGLVRAINPRNEWNLPDTFMRNNRGNKTTKSNKSLLASRDKATKEYRKRSLEGIERRQF
jgi:hypothetical protein